MSSQILPWDTLAQAKINELPLSKLKLITSLPDRYGAGSGTRCSHNLHASSVMA